MQNEPSLHRSLLKSTLLHSRCDLATAVDLEGKGLPFRGERALWVRQRLSHVAIDVVVAGLETNEEESEERLHMSC